MRTNSSRTARAFTLIELLVVMAIISLLMSITMPSLRSAKEKGHQVVCNTNLHNLILSWELYNNNNHQRLCSPFTGGEDGGSLLQGWVIDGPESSNSAIGGSEAAIVNGQLFPYVEDVDVYRCPSDKSGRIRGFAMSFVMGGTNGVRLDDTNPTGNIIARDTLKAVSSTPRTTGKLVFIDAQPLETTDAWIPGSFAPIKKDTTQWRANSYTASMTARHSGGCNVAFADGSCSSWKWKNPATIDFIENPTIDNTVENPGDIRSAKGNEDYMKVLTALDQKK